MTTVTIRKKLHEFIADADDKKIKGMFLLLEDEIIKKVDLSSRTIELDWQADW